MNNDPSMRPTATEALGLLEKCPHKLEGSLESVLKPIRKSIDTDFEKMKT